MNLLGHFGIGWGRFHIITKDVAGVFNRYSHRNLNSNELPKNAKSFSRVCCNEKMDETPLHPTTRPNKFIEKETKHNVLINNETYHKTLPFITTTDI